MTRAIAADAKASTRTRPSLYLGVPLVSHWLSPSHGLMCAWLPRALVRDRCAPPLALRADLARAVPLQYATLLTTAGYRL